MTETFASSGFTSVGTGVGSMPGTDAREAAAIVNGEVDLAHLVELPGRGLGADMIGRMAAILVDLPMDTTPSGYRLAQRPARVGRNAVDYLSADLDAVEELWDTAGFIGTERPFKTQICGPFTLAASVELPAGHKVLKDRGAWADVVSSTAEGLAAHVAEIRRRLGAQVMVQIDEPMIGAVIDGSVRPLTRYDPVPAIPVPEIAEALGELVSAAGAPVILHNCNTPRWDLIAALRGVAVSVDVTGSVDNETLDGIGTLIDRGDAIVAGIIRATGGSRIDDSIAERAATSLAEIFDRIGLPRNQLRNKVIVTPDCGLAGTDAARARAALAACAKVGALLSADPAAL